MNLLISLLEHYHLTQKDLDARIASGSFDLLKRPDGLKDFENVILKLENAIYQNKKCVIYGDYDVDGLTSTAILKIALDKKGLNPGFFIPSRYIEGYGLNVNRVKQFYDKGYEIIITIDNGISAVDSIKYAKSLGMEVIVIDHHHVDDIKIEADAIFHQTFSGFLEYNCSAASLAYFVSSRLLKQDDAYLASLAGLGVFSDQMPLIGNNLNFAKLMLSFINQYKFKNLCYLVGHSDITYEDVNFSIISPLNSIGRVMKDSISTNKACRYLLETNDIEHIKKLGDEILNVNKLKKEIVKNITFDEKYHMESDHLICELVDDYSGLTGIFANSMLNEKNKVAAVFSPKENDKDKFVCSIRSLPNIDLLSILNKNSKILLEYGGHPQACGATILKRDFYLFVTILASECSKLYLFNDKSKIDYISIALDEINEMNYYILKQFMPFGEGFKEPLFEVETFSNKFRIASSGKKAIYMDEKNNEKIVIFKNIDKINLTKNQKLFIIGRFTYDVFNNKITYHLIGDKIIVKGENDEINQ